MTVYKNPFGFMNEFNQPCDEQGNVLRLVMDTAATAAAETVNKITVLDPAMAHTQEADTDAEAAEFTRIRRWTVYVNGITLAHRFWETRVRPEAWEQASLAYDRRLLNNFVLISGNALVESGIHVTREDAVAVAKDFPHRSVYFAGQEVKA